MSTTGSDDASDLLNALSRLAITTPPEYEAPTRDDREKDQVTHDIEEIETARSRWLASESRRQTFLMFFHNVPLLHEFLVSIEDAFQHAQDGIMTETIGRLCRVLSIEQTETDTALTMFEKTKRLAVHVFEYALNVVSPAEDELEEVAATNIRLTLDDLRRIGR